MLIPQNKVTVSHDIFYYLFILCCNSLSVYPLSSEYKLREISEIQIKRNSKKKNATPAYVGVKNIYLYIHLYLLYLASVR
jgi:hypothetical protein